MPKRAQLSLGTTLRPLRVAAETVVTAQHCVARSLSPFGLSHTATASGPERLSASVVGACGTLPTEMTQLFPGTVAAVASAAQPVLEACTILTVTPGDG